MFKLYCSEVALFFLFFFLYISATPHAKFCHYTVQRTISLMTTISISTVQLQLGCRLVKPSQSNRIQQFKIKSPRKSQRLQEIILDTWKSMTLIQHHFQAPKKLLGGTGIFEVPLFRQNKPRSPDLLQKLWFTRGPVVVSSAFSSFF